MKEIWELFRTFFTIGSITFGGGYAVLPILIREIVEKKQWVTEEEMLDYFAISQSTPGVICVNISTFLGYRLKGLWGAVAATFGVILPSIVIITVVASVLSNFADIVWVQHAFAGIRIAVSALIASTVWNLLEKKRTHVAEGHHCRFFLCHRRCFAFFADLCLRRVCGVRRVLLRKEAQVMTYLLLAYEFSKPACLPSAAGWPRFHF